MSEWKVILTEEATTREVERRRAFEERARARGTVVLAPEGEPDEMFVTADLVRVEGGALLFVRDGAVFFVVGPTTYEQVIRLGE